MREARCVPLGPMDVNEHATPRNQLVPSLKKNMELKKTLQRLKRIEGDPCVSILVGTHRSHPDNAQDPINLKNLVDQAEERLLKDHDKRHVWPIMERIQAAVKEIDHATNLEGLGVFANADMAQVVKLPVAVSDRVIVDHNFATRDLIRALQSSAHYYIVTVSGHKSRLIQAHRDAVVVEYGAGHTFPMENSLYSTHADQRAQAGTEENLMKEFCNRVDKAVQEVHAAEPLPIIVAGDERNVKFLLEVADHKAWYIGHISGSPDDMKARELAVKAFAEVERLMAAREKDALEDMAKAQSASRLLDDVGDIHRAVLEGRGDTLYAEEGHFQPARIDGGQVTLKEDPTEAGVMDDIIDEIAENTLKFGGHVVFLPAGSLEQYRKVCLTTRY